MYGIRGNMIEKIPCIECQTFILPSTAETNNGICMPCKGGYRKNMEESKLRYEAEKIEIESPASKHWLWLVNVIYEKSNGFADLSIENQQYFATCLVEKEVYNGGFDQYFYNSSADYYSSALNGLIEIGAIESHKLLVSAKEILFGKNAVPDNQKGRIDVLRSKESKEISKKLDDLDKLFCKDPDNFQNCILKYSQQHRLYDDFS